MFRQIGPPELILIFAVFLLLFGAKKLPELARSSGRALRIFKAETKGDSDTRLSIGDEPTTGSALTGRFDVRHDSLEEQLEAGGRCVRTESPETLRMTGREPANTKEGSDP